MKKILAVVCLLLCSVFAPSIKAQTHIYIDGQVGPGSLGFASPHLAIGASIEQKFHRFEIDGRFLVSPDVKTFATKGHSFNVFLSPDVWITNHLAVHGGVEYSLYYSEIPTGRVPENSIVDGYYVYTYVPYKKGGFSPFVGVTIKDAWFGSPGRLDIDYLIPTGCVWATATNACPLTSPRELGIIAQQEFALWSRFHIGARGGWIQYGDQVNPSAPELGQPRHNIGFVDAIFRFELTRPKK